MNILFVNRMMGIAWGGGENYDYHLARGLQGLGHGVRFLTGRSWTAPARNRREIEMDAVRTPYLRRYMYQMAGKVRALPGLVSEFDLQLFERAALRAIPDLVRRHSIDVVQILSLPRMAAALGRRDLPVKVAMRFPGPPAWFHQPLLRRLSGRGVAMFAHGDTVGRLRNWGIAAAEVPPGVDAGLFGGRGPDPEPRAAMRSRLAGPEAGGEPFVIVSAGRLVHGKGYPFLLDAMAALAPLEPAARLVIVGDGPDGAALRAQAGRLGLGRVVIFAGHQPSSEVARWLSAGDVFCLLSDYENYSNAALEAMAAGLPVVATRVGGFPLQVEDGVNGFLVDPGDTAALTARLRTLAADAHLRHRLSAGAQRFSTRFCWKASAARVAEIYATILKS